MAAQVHTPSDRTKTTGPSIKAICTGKVGHSRQQSEDSCIFCLKKVRQRELPQLIQRSLYDRHCSSVNYYYTKDIKRIICKQRCSDTIMVKDLEIMDTRVEYLASYYELRDFTKNFDGQWRYHQFNIDQPRVFQKSIFSIVESYYGSKRKIQEKAIRRMLDALSDSELERCDLNLDPYMRETIEIEEKGPRPGDLLKNVYEPYNLKTSTTGNNKERLKRRKEESNISLQDISCFSMKLSLSYICRQQVDSKRSNLARLFQQNPVEIISVSKSDDVWENPGILPSQSVRLTRASFLTDQLHSDSYRKDCDQDFGKRTSNFGVYDHISSSRAMVDRISAAFSRARVRADVKPTPIMVVGKNAKALRQASGSQKSRKVHKKHKPKQIVNHSQKSSDNNTHIPERMISQNSPKPQKSKRSCRKRPIGNPLGSMTIDRSGGIRKLNITMGSKSNMQSTLWPNFGGKSTNNLHQNPNLKPLLKGNRMLDMPGDLIRSSMGISTTQMTSRDKSGMTQRSIKKMPHEPQVLDRRGASRLRGSGVSLQAENIKRIMGDIKSKDACGMRSQKIANLRSDVLAQSSPTFQKNSTLRFSGSILKSLTKGAQVWPKNGLDKSNPKCSNFKKTQTGVSTSKSQDKLPWAKIDYPKDIQVKKVAALKEKFIEETQRVLKSGYKLSLGTKKQQNTSPREGYKSLRGIDKLPLSLCRSRSRLSTQRSLVSDTSELARALSLSCRPKRPKKSQRRKSITKMLTKKKKQNQ